MYMSLPKVKNKKLINRKKFVKVAKKVLKSIEEEVNYLREKKIKNGDVISHNSYPLS